MWTVGHSTRPLDDLITLLRRHGIGQLADVRTLPRSRRNPQFNRETLPQALAAAGISYLHLPGLGGLRRPRRDSPNTAWRTPGFRGYADHMQTTEFEAALADLLAGAARARTAIMCAEALPWRCHRSLIADALVARGVETRHIVDERHVEAHTLRAWARVEGGKITYPAAPGLFD